MSAMAVILASFPVAQFIYRGIFQVTMYAQLNRVVIFVVIGMAAANVFIFCDAWCQSAHIKIMEDSQHRRMAYSFKRAAKAIAVASSTTSVAFAVNALSPLVPFRAFGINAAIIILVNCVLTIMLIPPLQIIYENHIRGRCALCCLKCCGKPAAKPAEP